MAAPIQIGTVVDRSNGGWYSGEAFYEGNATANFSDNYFNFGFKPEMIFIENVSGVGELEVSFAHKLFNENIDVVPTTVLAKLSAGESRIFRRRNHQYVSFRSSGSSLFRIEAW